jgi:hypothetical protein
MSDEVLDASAFRAPAVRLSGTVDYAMYNSFREQLGRAPANGLVVVELSTLGGSRTLFSAISSPEVCYQRRASSNARQRAPDCALQDANRSALATREL